MLGGVRQLRVGQVDPVAGREVGRELEAEQAVLLALRHRDRARGHRLLGGRAPDLQAPVALDVEDAAVGRDVELHRVLRVVVERDLLEVAGDGRRLPVVVAAVGGLVARGGLQAAEDVLEEVRLAVGSLGVAHARVPDAAALVVRAPRDRVVVVGAVAVVLAVRGLVDGREHVDAAEARAEVGDRRVAVDRRGDRALVVVPLVRARHAGRQAVRGGLVRVHDVDGRGGRSGRVVAERRRRSCRCRSPTHTRCRPPRGCPRSRRRRGCSARTRPAGWRRGRRRSWRGTPRRRSWPGWRR